MIISLINFNFNFYYNFFLSNLHDENQIKIVINMRKFQKFQIL